MSGEFKQLISAAKVLHSLLSENQIQRTQHQQMDGCCESYYLKLVIFCVKKSCCSTKKDFRKVFNTVPASNFK